MGDSRTARSLRTQHTNTLGAMAPELSKGYSAMVLGCIEDWWASAAR